MDCVELAIRGLEVYVQVRKDSYRLLEETR